MFTQERLARAPKRIGYPLRAPFEGMFSAHITRQYRVHFEVDEAERMVVVHRFVLRADAYRHR